MYHVNKEWIERWGFVGYLMDSIMPEIYEATSIRDFIENKDKIKPTTKRLGPAKGFRNTALVILPSVKLTRENQSLFRLSDITGAVDTYMHVNFLARLAEALTGKYQLDGRVAEAQLIYRPVNDGMYLFDIDRTPPIRDMDTERGRISFRRALQYATV